MADRRSTIDSGNQNNPLIDTLESNTQPSLPSYSLTPELQQYYKRLRNSESQKKWRSKPENHRKYLYGLKRWRSNNQDRIKEYRKRYSARKKLLAIIDSVDSGNRVHWGSTRSSSSSSPKTSTSKTMEVSP